VLSYSSAKRVDQGLHQRAILGQLSRLQRSVQPYLPNRGLGTARAGRCRRGLRPAATLEYRDVLSTAPALVKRDAMHQGHSARGRPPHGGPRTAARIRMGGTPRPRRTRSDLPAAPWPRRTGNFPRCRWCIQLWRTTVCESPRSRQKQDQPLNGPMPPLNHDSRLGTTEYPSHRVAHGRPAPGQ
jgi:hypothetical protein